MDNQQVRALFGIGTGIGTGVVIIFIVQLLSPFQPPSDLNLDDPVFLKKFMQNLPSQAFLIVLLSYFLGSAVGGWLTNLICRPTRYRPALIAGVGLLVFGVMNLISLPHPSWFYFAAPICFLAGAWLGGRVGR